MRYGEADRILHLYTPHRGRVSAIAKGVRRARSRFGGRLEPFFRLRSSCTRGAGELLTVTGAQTVEGYAAPARRRRARWTPPRARATPSGACSRPPSRIRACSTCCAASCPCSTTSARAAGRPSGRAGALAFRLKLLLAAGLAPQLGACASCGEREHLVGFSGAAGGVVCGACEAGVVSAGRGGLPLHDRGARPAAGEAPQRARAGARAGRAGDLGDARAPRAPAPDAGRRRAEPRCCAPRRLVPVSWAPWTRACRSPTRCSTRACPCWRPTASRWARCTTSCARAREGHLPRSR